MKRTLLSCILALIALPVCRAQNVRFGPYELPSVSSLYSPLLQANLPPNSPVLAVCHSPANQVPCTNYATTFQYNGTACPNGAQDTPDPNATTAACQVTGDAQGNIAWWAPAGQYDFTVCIQTTCLLYTVTQGSGGGGGGTASLLLQNAAVTGTTLNTLAKLTGAPSAAVISATTDTGQAVGIVTAGAGTIGVATIQISGLVSCVFSGGTTAGDYVEISNIVAGNCADTSSASYPTSGQVIGRVLSTNVGAGTYLVDLFPAEIQGFSGGGGSLPTGFTGEDVANTSVTSGTTYSAISNRLHTASFPGLTLDQILALCPASPTACYIIGDPSPTPITIGNTPALIGSITQPVLFEDEGVPLECTGTAGNDCIEIGQWGALVCNNAGPAAGSGNGCSLKTASNAVITSDVTNYDHAGGQSNFQFKGFDVYPAGTITQKPTWNVAIEGKGALRDLGLECGNPGTFGYSLEDGPATGDVNALVIDNIEFFAGNKPCVPLNIQSTSTGTGEGSNYAFIGSSIVDSTGTLASTATSSAITSTGVQTVSVPSTTGIYVNGYVTITGSDAHTERVLVSTVVTNTSFTATFGLTHVTSSTVTSVGPCVNGDYCLENVDGTSGTNGVVANTTTTAAITVSGAQAVTTAATTGIILGVPVEITGSDSHTEYPVPTCVNTTLCPGGFSANFTLTHVNGSAVTTQGNHYVSGIGQLCPYYESHTGMTGEYSEIRNVRGYFNVCFALNGGPGTGNRFRYLAQRQPFHGAGNADGHGNWKPRLR